MPAISSASASHPRMRVPPKHYSTSSGHPEADAVPVVGDPAER